ncbi:MAG TPA: sialidase family protein, partial [Ktedonobacterales bacterium]
MLLAACGQTTTSATNGANAGLQALKTPPAMSGTPSPTAIPLPYTFPKQWLSAPDSAHLPPQLGGIIFSSSSPQTGYVCGITSSMADNSTATPPFVVATNTGCQSWHTVSGSVAHAKSACNLFIDQNNARDIFAAAGDLHGQLPLYRSQDGGVTWKHINQPTIANMSIIVMQVAVVQSRLIAMIGVNGEGVPPHSFYASDDGGQSWAPLNIVVNGASIDAGEQLWFDGPALVVEASPSCAQGCGYSAPASNWRGVRQRLDDPLSSQPPSPNYYYQSTDGGRTWTTFPMPVSNLSNLTFTRSANGLTTYALGTATGVPNQPAVTNVAFYSADGGAHWRQLPTLASVENGYLDPSSLGALGAFVFPDGSVATTAFHGSGLNNDTDAGAFLLHPDVATPTWQPLILRVDGKFWQSVPTATGIRVWQVRMQPDNAVGQLVYFDLP